MAKTYYPRAKVVLDVLIDGAYTASGTAESHTYSVVPRSVDIVRNDTRNADTFNVELDYRDFPMEPRAIADARVVIYLKNVDNPTDDIQEQIDDQAFTGHIDEPETTLDGSGETVRLSGRDNTGLFLDKEWTNGSLNIDRSLLDVVSDIVYATPYTQGMTVIATPAAASTNLYSVKGRKKWTPAAGDDNWTIITELCGFLGLIPVVKLDTLFILAADDLGATESKFLYGKNVARLSYVRKQNDLRSKQIQIVCHDETVPETKTATYPAQPFAVSTKVDAEGKVSQDLAPVKKFFVSGTYSTDDLMSLAEQMYNEASLPQVEGDLETMDLTDLDDESDLTKVQNGDAITLRLGKVSDVTSISGMSEGEAVQYLTEQPRNFNRQVARALVSAWKSAESASVTTTFYVRTANLHWGREDGFRLSISFINYAAEG